MVSTDSVQDLKILNFFIPCQSIFNSISTLTPSAGTHSMYNIAYKPTQTSYNFPTRSKTGTSSSSKQSLGIFPTNTSQPLGRDAPSLHPGGGPYRRCPFSWTNGYPVRSMRARRGPSRMLLPPTGVGGGAGPEGPPGGCCSLLSVIAGKVWDVIAGHMDIHGFQKLQALYLTTGSLPPN